MARKIPRGKGYDKASTLAHVKKMVKGGTLVTGYVKSAGLKLDTFMLAVNKYGLRDVSFEDPNLITAQCEYCGEDYWPRKKGTKWCSPYCGNLSRKDEQYFGGNRRSTIGLKEGVCGLCERRPESGLSSHHLYGKGNDEVNEHLLALCKGCHAIVSDLALKTWCGDTQKLERLILLAHTQRFGENWMKRRTQGLQLSVQVTLGTESSDLVTEPAIDQGD